MKGKAFIWILSLNDEYKPVCDDIWPSKVLLLLFHGLLVHTYVTFGTGDSTFTTWSTANAYLIANLLLVEFNLCKFSMVLFMR